MASDRPSTIAEHLRTARRLAGFTQEELAERAGVSARGISDIERGVIQAPHRETLELIMDALGTPADTRALWRATRDNAAVPSRQRERRRKHARPASLTLPMARTALIGREQEIEHVRQLIQGE